MVKGITDLAQEQKALSTGSTVATKKMTDEQIGLYYQHKVGSLLAEQDPVAAKALGLDGQGNPPAIGQVVGAMKDPDILNKFFNAVNQAMFSIFKGDVFSHPLSKFKMPYSPTGGYILKTVVNPPKMHEFDPTLGTSSFQRENMDLYQEIHSHALSVYAEITLQDTFTQQMVANWTQFDELVAIQMQSLPNAGVIAEYEGMKEVISVALMSGESIIKKIPTDNGIVDTMALQRQFKNDITNMSQQPSDEFNVHHRMNQPVRDNLTILLTTETATDLDLNLFANLYNVAFADPKTAITTINRFSDLWFYEKDHTVTAEDISGGFLDGRKYKVGSVIESGTKATPGAPESVKKFDGSKVLGGVFSNDWLIFVDQLMENNNFKVSSIVDPVNRSTNVFMHIQQIQSISPVENNIFYMTDDVETVSFNGKTGEKATYLYNSGTAMEITEQDIKLIPEVETAKVKTTKKSNK